MRSVMRLILSTCKLESELCSRSPSRLDVTRSRLLLQLFCQFVRYSVSFCNNRVRHVLAGTTVYFLNFLLLDCRNMAIFLFALVLFLSDVWPVASARHSPGRVAADTVASARASSDSRDLDSRVPGVCQRHQACPCLRSTRDELLSFDGQHVCSAQLAERVHQLDPRWSLLRGNSVVFVKPGGDRGPRSVSVTQILCRECLSSVSLSRPPPFSIPPSLPPPPLLPITTNALICSDRKRWVQRRKRGSR